MTPPRGADPNDTRPRGTRLVPPTGAERDAWHACVALSIANGYRPRNVSVFFFETDETVWGESDNGEVLGRCFKGADVAYVYIRRNLAAAERRRVMLHELGHAIDQGYVPGITLRAVAEGWADIFAESMLRRLDERP